MSLKRFNNRHFSMFYALSQAFTSVFSCNNAGALRWVSAIRRKSGYYWTRKQSPLPSRASIAAKAVTTTARSERIPPQPSGQPALKKRALGG